MNDAVAMAVMTGVSASRNSLTNHVDIGSKSHCLLRVSRIIRDTFLTVVLVKPGNGGAFRRLMVGGGRVAVATRIASTLLVK